MKNSKVYAIDFGTTFSEYGYLKEDGRPEVIKNPSGRRKLRTAVWFKDGSGKKFGSTAARAGPVHPDSVLQEFKPDFDDTGTEFKVDGKKLKPVEVAELFYGHMKSRIKEATGETPDRVVITIPAYFHDIGYQVLKRGAEAAGFKIERILREPASAAVGYAINNPLNHKETVLVYDFGGGTFDASILEVTEENDSPKFDTVGNRGRTNLGGKDFTVKIVKKVFAKEFRNEHGTDPTDKPEVRAEWLRRAEDMKKSLSENKSDIDLIQAEKKQVSVELTRDKFEGLIEPEVEETLDITEKLLDETGKDRSSIDRLVLVGGTTRIPLIQKEVSNFIGLEPEKGVDPDLAVITGAILVGGAKGNQVIRNKKGVRVPLLASEVRDVTSRGIGIKAVNPDTGEEYHEVLIPKGEPLEAKGSKPFYPDRDDADTVSITILEGDSEDIDDCRKLQEDYELEISTSKKKEEVKIEISLIVNKDGLIEVMAETEYGDRMREEFTNPNILDKGDSNG
ncbi:Hsp70 family protein [Candidatus Bipolaricaulota bacterium]|nr:Hsp70 family protein [Candidatus Bipolaricaulota bacterium]